MNRNAILFADRDIDFLFIRLDRDRNGRISYSEVNISKNFLNIFTLLKNLIP